MSRKLAEKRPFIPRKNRIVYVFNIKGEQVDSGSSKEIDDKYDLKGLVRMYVSSGRLKAREYYFSLSEKIEIKESKWSYNPVIKKKLFDKKEELKKYDINYKPKD